MVELRRGAWHLTDLKSVPSNGRRVFSCFSCGGGSTMGYKLAGYTVVGCCEIDPQMMKVYRANHRPALPFQMSVAAFNRRLTVTDLPPELVDLDILDGSPPCSSFSVSGSREKAWGKKKKFREGQAEQVLDDLFFDFIETARLLQPKIIVAENVKGLIKGAARGYVKQIFTKLREAGYDTQLFLLNAVAMGVPQRRERTFFLARRKDLGLPPIKLVFDETQISIAEAIAGAPPTGENVEIKPGSVGDRYFDKCALGQSLSTVHEKGSLFNWYKLDPRLSANTIAPANSRCMLHGTERRMFTSTELARLQSFPDDYNFTGVQPLYVIGMSVPPFMLQRIADQIQKQWLGTLPSRASRDHVTEVSGSLGALGGELVKEYAIDLAT